MIFQQRTCATTACRRISFLLLAVVFAFSFLCGNIGRAAVPSVALYDAASVLCDLQRDAPALTGEAGEPAAPEAVFDEILPVLCLLARFDLPVAPAAAFPARAIPTPRRADFWGLIPFSLAPPRLA